MARTPSLDTGDDYIYALSVLARPNPGSDVWIRVEVKGHVREDESGAKAARRIENFVEDRVNRKVDEIMSEDE